MATLPKFPFAAAPRLQLVAADLLGQVHAFEAGPLGGHLLQRVEVEMALGIMGDGDGRRPFAADQPGQRPRIDRRKCRSGRWRPSMRKILLAAEVGRRRHRLAHQAAERMRFAGFDILFIGADIADVREGEGDDLPSERDRS